MNALTIETKLGEMRLGKKKIKIVFSPYSVQFTHIRCQNSTEKGKKTIDANALTITAIASLCDIFRIGGEGVI
jgi:hypothetical protein